VDVSRTVFKILMHKARKWFVSQLLPWLMPHSGQEECPSISSWSIHCWKFHLGNEKNPSEYLGETYLAKTRVIKLLYGENWGTAAAAPPPFRSSDPALCGSRPLVTPYYCRLGDLLCLFCVYPFVSLSLFALSFVDLPSVLWYCWLGLLTCKNRLPYNLYCIGGDVKHCSLTHWWKLHNPWGYFQPFLTVTWVGYTAYMPSCAKMYRVQWQKLIL